MGEDKKVDVPAVPETILKKRRSSERIKALKAKEAIERVQHREKNRKEAFKRAEKYVKEYRNEEKALVADRKKARADGDFFLEPEAKIAFVIRIRGINGVPPRPRKILQLLRLKQIHNGVFVRLNKATINMIKLVNPYVTWGYPSLKTIRELVYKRGHGKVHGSRIALSENSIIENALGQHNVLCIEDVVHELVTVGPHFREVNNFLWPFKLNNPKGGFKKITHPFNDGGDSGNREHFINDLIRKMN